VVLATNHSQFCGAGTLRAIADSAKRDAVIADPWNCFGAAQVFSYATEIVALGAR
jgi:UDP-N-acetyl-D-mannosaminuronic acid dehydrogenase